MSGVPWRRLLRRVAAARPGVRADSGPSTATGPGADVDAVEDRHPDVTARGCPHGSEVQDDLATAGQLRAWRERGLLFTSQHAPDVVAVHVGALTIHVWHHPDGALIEAVDADDRRHAAYVSICRDPEEAGGRASILAISHGAQCAERPTWPVMDAEARATATAGD